MNIACTQYSLKYQSFEIYLSGCNGSCMGCCNPELKDFNYGNKITIESMDNLIQKIYKCKSMIDRIWILGGDPLDQNTEELANLIKTLKLTKKEIWLWTRFNVDNVPCVIRDQCDYIKCGAYIPELKTDMNIQYGIRLATSNQCIYKIGRI